MADGFLLPRGAEAVIPPDKLVEYVLNPEHPRGRHKARVFHAALAIEPSDWRYLRDQLLAAVVEVSVSGTRVTSFGVLYEVLIPVDGLNGATHPVTTVWIVEGTASPRLVSAWVDIP